MLTGVSWSPCGVSLSYKALFGEMLREHLERFQGLFDQPEWFLWAVFWKNNILKLHFIKIPRTYALNC